MALSVSFGKKQSLNSGTNRAESIFRKTINFSPFCSNLKDYRHEVHIGNNCTAKQDHSIDTIVNYFQENLKSLGVLNIDLNLILGSR